MTHNPLVSIITITYNSELTVKDTIESILNQTYNNFEYIIIDGESSDRTLEIVKSYKNVFEEKKIDFKFLSEKDKGIADAWNKGLKLSNGLIIGMLNSDDWYDKNTIVSVVNLLNSKKAEISYGICKRVNNKKEVLYTMDIKFNPNRVYLNFGFSHTTCFMTKKTVDEVGEFNTNYKIAIDTDFLLRCIKKKIPFIKCKNITYMRLGGISTKFEKAAFLEYQKALIENNFNIILIKVFGFIKACIFLWKKLKI